MRAEEELNLGGAAKAIGSRGSSGRKAGAHRPPSPGHAAHSRRFPCGLVCVLQPES